MKALTLYQPWATLVAIGAKKIETRSWGTKYRGPLAIHASLNKKFVKMYSKDYICDKKFFGTILKKEIERISSRSLAEWIHYWMPFGKIIAIVKLDACQIISAGPRPPWLSDQEMAFGNYEFGRYIWFLKMIHKLRKPIPIKGSRGLWEWDIPSFCTICEETMGICECI